MPRGGPRPKPNPLSSNDPSHIEKRQKNNEAVKKTREKQKMIDKELDEQIAYQTRIMNFQQKKIEAIKNIMDQISSATRMKMSYEQIEEIRRNFFNCASIVVQEMAKFDAQNSAQLSYDLSLMSNHRSQKELVVAMVEFLSHLFQLKTPPAESTQHNTLLPQTSNELFNC